MRFVLPLLVHYIYKWEWISHAMTEMGNDGDQVGIARGNVGSGEMTKQCRKRGDATHNKWRPTETRCNNLNLSQNAAHLEPFTFLGLGYFWFNGYKCWHGQAGGPCWTGTTNLMHRDGGKQLCRYIDTSRVRYIQWAKKLSHKRSNFTCQANCCSDNKGKPVGKFHNKARHPVPCCAK